MEFTFDWLLNQVLGFGNWVWSFWQVKFILGHIALNVVAATAASIYTKEFLLGKLGEFLYRKVLPSVMLFGAFAAFGQATKLEAMTMVAFAGIETMLAADLFDNLKRVGLKATANRGGDGGFQVPDWLTKE